MKQQEYSGKQLRSRGFTLVELAVVIVVIALIIGGVMIGRNIIHNSQLQTVLVDKDKYFAAIQQFQMKYNYLPGDFPNATSLWGTDTGCPTSVTPNTVKKAATCNGNGNGQIDWQGGTWDEWFRVWQHLANAGMIPGMYTGTSAPSPPAAGYAVMSGMNMPAGSIDSSLFFITFVTNAAGSLSWFSPIYEHFLVFSSNHRSWGPPLTPVDAKMLDGKADDGLPGMGVILGGAGNGYCITSVAPTSAAYNLSYGSGKACDLYFRPGV